METTFPACPAACSGSDGSSPAASVNLFYLSCRTVAVTVARLCLGPAHPAALERVGEEGSHGICPGAPGSVGRWRMLCLFWKGLGLGRMDTPGCMMVSDPTVDLLALSSGLDSAAAMCP